MAALILQQTATSAPTAGAFCSGLTANTGGSYTRQASQGGAAGAAASVTVDASAAALRAIYYKCVIPSGATWAAGTWTIRVNVTTAASNVTITRAFVCRVNSSDVNQATLGSNTGLAVDVSTTGVKSFTVSQASPASPAAGDNVVIVLGVSNSATMTRSLGLTPDQAIDTPFTVPIDTKVAPQLLVAAGEYR